MAQPYLRGKRWYLKYKDARGRWQDKVCNARAKGRALELLPRIARGTGSTCVHPRTAAARSMA